MGRRTPWLLSVRRSLPLFLAIVVCLAVWQAWLTWQLTVQDRNLAEKRSRESLEQAAELAVVQLTRTLGDWDLSLRELVGLPPDTAHAKRSTPETLFLLTARSVVIRPAQPLLFVPNLPSAADTLSKAFEPAAQLEFRDEKYAAAIEALRPLAAQSVTRPEAVLRIARLQRKLGLPEAALATYRQMSQETAVSPSGVPYALLAAGARCQLLAAAGNSSEAAAEAGMLRAALLEGRWRVRRETFEFYWSEVNRLSHTAEDPPKSLLETSSLVSRLYDQWQQAARCECSFSGRELGGDSSLLLWHAEPARLAALSAPPGWLDSAMKLPANAARIRWTLIPSGGQPPAPAGRNLHVTRSLAEAQLTGRLDFAAVPGVEDRGSNRALWLAGVVLMLVLVLSGAYAMYRGVTRELRVAQLQSDFVSAVSHEFRSPLTTLRTISELLAHDRLPEESRRRQSYAFLERETGRLHRLVEDLLDFGRMESGRKQYRAAPYDAFSLVRAAVADFREDAMTAGFEIELNLETGAPIIEADEEALRRALRNLLENAVKYSPESRTVWVEGAIKRRQVAISVRDRGMGIEPKEQRQIFQKFVRGSSAKKAGIKGTGIGLSMVRQIMDASGGEVCLESAVGSGSTFTLLLPLARNGKDA